jgi:hypothetical protein
VKAFIRAFCLALVTVGMLGVTGCGPDNETEGQKLGKSLGDPGAPDPSVKAEAAKPPMTQEEVFKRSQGQQDALKSATPSKGAPKK